MESGWCTRAPAKQEGFQHKQLQPTEICTSNPTETGKGFHNEFQLQPPLAGFTILSSLNLQGQYIQPVLLSERAVGLQQGL